MKRTGMFHPKIEARLNDRIETARSGGDIKARWLLEMIVDRRECIGEARDGLLVATMDGVELPAWIGGREGIDAAVAKMCKTGEMDSLVALPTQQRMEVVNGVKAARAFDTGIDEMATAYGKRGLDAVHEALQELDRGDADPYCLKGEERNFVVGRLAEMSGFSASEIDYRTPEADGPSMSRSL